MTGLAFEARIAAGPNIAVVYGLDRPLMIAALEAAAGAGARGIISFGVAGGLDEGFAPGDAVVARTVITDTDRFDADPAWIAALLKALPAARAADIAGVEAALVTAEDKRALHLLTGASAVDMESHVAAAVARKHGIPFSAVRLIIDPVHRTLPPAALAGMSQNGQTNLGAVLMTLARRPSQLPPLLQIAMDARKARAGLLRSRQAMGLSLGFPYAD